ncbi:hypothetical protein N7454_009286 [Penicillium verhagenii]|nr:hypothetical protein N7454_009286 [Penicillium verhagenii]
MTISWTHGYSEACHAEDVRNSAYHVDTPGIARGTPAPTRNLVNQSCHSWLAVTLSSRWSFGLRLGQGQDHDGLFRESRRRLVKNKDKLHTAYTRLARN